MLAIPTEITNQQRENRSADVAALQGATIIIGNTLVTPQSVVHVPIYGRLSRVEVLALAAETMLAGRTIYNPTLLERTAIVFAITLGFALALQ